MLKTNNNIYQFGSGKNGHSGKNLYKASRYYCISFMLMALMSVFMSGCGVTKMLHPPLKEELFAPEATRALIGEWQLQDGEALMSATITKNPGSDEKIEFLSILLQKKDSDGVVRNYPPLMGIVQKIDDALYLIVTADLEQFCKTTGYSNDWWLVIPIFHAILLTPEESGYKLKIVSFMDNKGTESKPKWEALNPAIKLEGDLVLNSTDSLIELIRTSQWRAGKNFTLKPVKMTKDAPTK